MPTLRVAVATCAIVLLTACGGAGQGSIPHSGAGEASQSNTVSTKQFVVNGTGSTAPSVTMIEYNVPGLPSSGGVTVAKDGAVWWQSSVNGVGDMVRMQGTSVTVVPGPIASSSLPAAASVPFLKMASTPDGRVWGAFTLSTPYGYLYQLGSATNGAKVISPGLVIPPNPTSNDGGNLGFLVTGPDGNVWWTYHGSGPVSTPDVNDPLIGNSSGLLTLPPDNNTTFLAVTVGPDKDMWFLGTAYGALFPPSNFARYTTSGEYLGTIDLSTPISVNQNAVTGPDGAIWVPDQFFPNNQNTFAIGRITSTGAVTNYPLPNPRIDNADPRDITVGGDGALWFTIKILSSNASAVGRITTSGQITEYPLPAGFDAFQITGPYSAAGCGNAQLWVSSVNGPLMELVIKS